MKLLGRRFWSMRAVDANLQLQFPWPNMATKKKKKRKFLCYPQVKWNNIYYLGRSVKIFFNYFLLKQSTKFGCIFHLFSQKGKNTHSDKNWVHSRPYFYNFGDFGRSLRAIQHHYFFLGLNANDLQGLDFVPSCENHIWFSPDSFARINWFSFYDKIHNTAESNCYAN